MEHFQGTCKVEDFRKGDVLVDFKGNPVEGITLINFGYITQYVTGKIELYRKDMMKPNKVYSFTLLPDDIDILVKLIQGNPNGL